MLLLLFVTIRLLPQRVKNSPVVPDPEQLIRGCYPVRISVLGIPKDGVREPNQTNHIADGEREKKRGWGGGQREKL